MPATTTGKWSVGFGVAFLALLVLSVLVIIIIGGDSANVAAVIAANPLLSIFNIALNLTLNLAGLLSLLLGAYTIVKYKDWSVGKYLVLLYALALLTFILGEFLFPH